MKVGRKGKALVCAAVLIVLLIVAIFLDLSYAPDPISFSQVWAVICGNGDWASSKIVPMNAERVCIGIVVGSGLAVSGAVMQAMFRNPMASPYILGLSSGASLGAAIGILFTIPFIPQIVSAPLLAFVFCLLTMFLVYGVSRIGGVTHTETLILTGIAVSSLMSALVSFLTFISGDKMEDIVFWTMGSLSRASFEETAAVAIPAAAGMIIMYSYSKDLNAMMIGDSHAMDLGIDVGRTRLILLIASTIVTASAVAFAGSIGFVGLIIPHIFRILLGPDNRILIPISALGGAAFLVFCDWLAHVIAPQYGVLPIGILTAIVGAPYFIYLLRRRRNEVGW